MPIINFVRCRTICKLPRLPATRILGIFIVDHTSKVYIPVSAYYFTDMRDEMTGTICGIGFFLLCYHGYDRQDSIISKLSGFFALCIAFFPTVPSSVKDDLVSNIHYITAGCFFALLAYMSIFLFTKSTAEQMTHRKKLRNRIYRICGIVMAVAVVGIPIDGIDPIYLCKRANQDQTRMAIFIRRKILEWLAAGPERFFARRGLDRRTR